MASKLTNCLHKVGILALSTTLWACDKDTDTRGKIAKTARGGALGRSQTKVIDDKEGCMSLVLVDQSLKANDQQVARIATTDIVLFNRGKEITGGGAIKDTKLLAQLLNAGGELKAEYRVERVADVRSGELLNVVSQSKCERVTLKDAHGLLREFEIISGKSRSARMVLSALDNSGEIRRIEMSNDRLRVNIIRPLAKTTVCGRALDLSAGVVYEVAIGSGNGPVAVSRNFANLIADHTDASATLKELVNSAAGRTAEIKEASRTRTSGGTIVINETVLGDALLHMQAGKFKNVECGGSPQAPAAAASTADTSAAAPK